MNIFRLSDDPAEAALFVDDTHVYSQLHENALMLSTALNEHGVNHPAAMGSTHINHPTTAWVREGRGNYRWVYDFTQALYAEKVYRYGGGHDSWEECVAKLPRSPECLSFETTPMPIVGTASEYDGDDAVEAYRWAYAQSEREYVRGRDAPDWYRQMRQPEVPA